MNILQKQFEDDGSIPNNQLKALIYKLVFEGNEARRPEHYEQLFRKNGWSGAWRNGIFSYHHYHSTAHEVLGIYTGWADVLLGGDRGEVLRVEAGDIITTSGRTHGQKTVQQSDRLGVIGAYPQGQPPGMGVRPPR
ncbi:MAG: hypothetical protein U5P10_09340 [Spirochaetia bacterium]|nr:hypothetical protein [Spirochaetia bacterium]